MSPTHPFPSVLDRVDGPRPLHHLSGLTRERVWLTIPQLAEHGKFMTSDGRSFSPEAARAFLYRHPDLPRAKRGTRVMVDRDVFDRYVAAGDKRTA
jgi:hypothetical protein